MTILLQVFKIPSEILLVCVCVHALYTHFRIDYKKYVNLRVFFLTWYVLNTALTHVHLLLTGLFIIAKKLLMYTVH